MEAITAVAYYRMSSDKQEASIGDQRTAVEKYARERGYRILREYVDEGISGWKSEQRKGFQRLPIGAILIVHEVMTDVQRRTIAGVVAAEIIEIGLQHLVAKQVMVPRIGHRLRLRNEEIVVH